MKLDYFLKLTLYITPFVLLPGCRDSPPKNEPDDFEFPAQCEDSALIHVDANLAKSIHDDLELPAAEPLTCGDLESLTDFSSAGINRGILSIEGLQYATNLNYVDLSKNLIQDVSPLSYHSKIATLILNANDIEADFLLTDLPMLSSIHLDANADIQDLNGLAQLTYLQYVGVGDTAFAYDWTAVLFFTTNLPGQYGASVHAWLNKGDKISIEIANPAKFAELIKDKDYCPNIKIAAQMLLDKQGAKLVHSCP